MQTKWRIATLALLAVALLSACGNAPEEDTGDSAAGASQDTVAEPAADAALSGTVEIDGSSTVAPITDAVAEEFNAEQPDVEVNVGVSGTGGGFERFCAGETDISDASRPIDEEEAALCEQAGIQYVELQVGTDALTMVTSPQTDFVSCLTTAEVTRIFGPDDSAATWADVNADFPDEPLEVFAPGTDSGTYDFMVEDVLGLEAARQDYSAAEDDNIIAQGVQGTPGAWGFFGFAYYVENEANLRAIEYDAGNGCVAPSVETAQDGSYGMTRPLFIYVNTEALARPEVEQFVRFYLDNAEALVADVGYIPEPTEDLQAARDTFEQALAG
jgi:phosphate transport system substrate-binding protein